MVIYFNQLELINLSGRKWNYHNKEYEMKSSWEPWIVIRFVDYSQRSLSFFVTFLVAQLLRATQFVWKVRADPVKYMALSF